MSNDPSILDLSSDFAPVHRCSMLCKGGLVLAMGVMLPDMSHMAGPQYLVWRGKALAFSPSSPAS